MPREARTPEAIETQRQRILALAAELIRTHGFDALSMRRLAKESGMTAANLYNYVSGKDQLYLEIQQKGFTLLGRALTNAMEGPETPVANLRLAARAYLRFAHDNPDLYKVMFAVETPKYADYKGTDAEADALAEKSAALSVLAAAKERVRQADPGLSDEALHHEVLFLWSALHGIANLLHSRILQEATEDPGPYIAYAVDRLTRG